MKRVFAAAATAATLLSPASAQERVDLDAVTRIRQEGFRRSKVMDLASELMDGIGPRVTGSPNMKAANEWARAKFESWGLVNAHLESWGPFGRGWTWEGCSVRMLSPDTTQFIAIPQAWTPGTNGPIRAKAVRVNVAAASDLDKFHGKLAGAAVLFGEWKAPRVEDKPLSQRYDEKGLGEIAAYAIPGVGPARFNREEYQKRRELAKVARKFFADEKVAAVLSEGSHDGGTLGVQEGGSQKTGEPEGVPWVVLTAEHFGRLSRLLEREVPVELEIDVRARFLNGDPTAWNTVAEIPGTEKKGEVVMLGAHLDSWQGGTGATDNGAGSVAAMEAVRILETLGLKPRRTIRIALWSGEEQGLLGSRAYVAEHFGSFPYTPEELEKPSFLRKPSGPLSIKPEHAKLAGYFNLDNGTGKVRGIYVEENAAVVPVFEAWMAPLKDLGVTTVTMNDTSGTDHVSFDTVGLPGFQFIQDEIEYESRTHHTNMDVYERLQKADLMQASIVMAVFVWQAANRDAQLPRKPLPRWEPEKKEKAGEETPAKPSGGGAR
ncbi:MAG TPA: M20/M25/M40 family metallo-hydrolase [Thermoanaerobaculia bacterium]